MRQAEPIWELWSSGGPFIGENRAVGIVTVEWDWKLQEHRNVGNLDRKKQPIRAFQSCRGLNFNDHMKVPNVKSIEIDSTIDADADTCTIVMYNQQMKKNLEGQTVPNELGSPGFYTPGFGLGYEEQARWRHDPNAWVFALTPNSLIRTFQGYGGNGDVKDNWRSALEDDLDTGHLLQTGTWLVDSVTVGTDGMLRLNCRSMAKLLLDQQLYPPLVPRSSYPLSYSRFVWKNETHTRTKNLGKAGGVTLRYHSTANSAWYSGGVVHGHHPGSAFDGNPNTYWYSTGNAGPQKPFATEWVQADAGNQYVDEVTIHPWAGNYDVYISVHDGNGWVDEHGGARIPYQPLGVGRYRPAYEPSIAYVKKFGAPWETKITVKLPRAYKAKYIRFTFTNLARSPHGRYPYRAGLREATARLSTDVNKQESYTKQVKHDGNFKDYTDIIKDLLLWSGFWCRESLGSNEAPHVHGRLEETGAYPPDPLPPDLFDKRPIIDPITEIREVVGYMFWIGPEGEANFRAPNVWSAGNYDDNGLPTDYIPHIDERVQLTNGSMTMNGADLRSEIIIASEDPDAGFKDMVVTRYTPPSKNVLRGMIVPAMWVNSWFIDKEEQQLMAETIAMNSFFAARQYSVTCWANPNILIDDQVRIYERNTATTYIHYVRGYRTQMDLDSGEYIMDLTTHWLGTPEADWSVEEHGN